MQSYIRKNKVLKLGVALMACAFGLYADFTDEVVIDSGHVECKKGDLVFTENVSFESSIGHLAANEVKIRSTSDQGGSEIDHIQMRDHVSIALKDMGTLQCEKADVHLSSLSVFLQGEEDYVTYHDGKKSPCRIQAKNMAIELGRGDHPLEKNVFLKFMNAEHEVSFDYHQDLVIRADQALYQINEERSNGGVPLQLSGVLLLKRLNDEGQCQMVSSQGDCVNADQVSFDLEKKQLYIHRPEGYMCVDRKGKTQEKVEFSAGALFWDRIKRKFMLRDRIHAVFEDIGQFTTEDEMLLTYDEVNGKKRIQNFECLGETLLTVLDQKKNFDCTFACYGMMKFDKRNGQITMKSPKDVHGKVLEGKQVFLRDGIAKISADKVKLFYEWVEDKKVLDKVLLEGDVHLINRLTTFTEEEGPLQFALADVIEYIPKTKELNLLSSGKHRVLFLDRVNHIQISAPALRIKRSTPAQKGYIQGVGDVRFSFVKQEVELMKHSFTASEESIDQS